MKLFQCQNCGQPLYFENTRCERCGLALGYLPDREAITALKQEGDGADLTQKVWRALADQKTYRYCANAAYDVCNWLVPTKRPDAYCLACRHNRIIPDLSFANNLEKWRALEVAKHRLFYTLVQLGLPTETRWENPAGLAFKFLADVEASDTAVMTGHVDGVITINIAEADDAERERRRQKMGELYRTPLGHFRHEIGHYYWDRLIADSPHLETFRRVFGDERRDYDAALKNYYANGPAPDWSEHLWLRELASLGRFRRDLGALLSHDRHTRNRPRCRFGGKSTITAQPGRGVRLSSERSRHGPTARGMDRADVRGQFDQSEHGLARPLPVCAWSIGSS